MKERQILLLKILVMLSMIVFAGLGAVFGYHLSSSDHPLILGNKEYYNPLTGGPPSPGSPISQHQVTDFTDIQKFMSVSLFGLTGFITPLLVGCILCKIFRVDPEEMFGN